MSLELQAGNLILVAGITGLLIFLWNQLHNSKLPAKRYFVNPTIPVYSKKPNLYREHPKVGEKYQYTESEFQEILDKEDRRHRKEMIIYILTYFSPMIFAFFSLVSILNLNFSFSLFVISVALTFISVFIIKFKGVGLFYGT